MRAGGAAGDPSVRPFFFLFILASMLGNMATATRPTMTATARQVDETVKLSSMHDRHRLGKQLMDRCTVHSSARWEK